MVKKKNIKVGPLGAKTNWATLLVVGYQSVCERGACLRGLCMLPKNKNQNTKHIKAFWVDRGS